MAKETPSGWGKVWQDTQMEIAYRLEITNVTASGWALGRTQEEIEREARRRLREDQGIEYPERRRT
jgi:hypothetical protein